MSVAVMSMDATMRRLAVLSKVPEAPGWVDEVATHWDVNGERAVMWRSTLHGEHGMSVDVEQSLIQSADAPVEVSHAYTALNHECDLTAEETKALGDLLTRAAQLLAAADLAVVRLT